MTKRPIALIRIRHYGLPFEDSTHARVVVSGVLHHWVIVYDDIQH